MTHFQLVITTKVKKRSQFGDLLIGASFLFSSYNFAIELFSSFINMPFKNKSTYYRYQANYFLPVVEKVWEDVQVANIAKSKNKPVVVLGKLTIEFLFISNINFLIQRLYCG